MNKRILRIGDQDIEFTGYIFDKWFGALLFIALVSVTLASIKYIIN